MGHLGDPIQTVVGKPVADVRPGVDKGIRLIGLLPTGVVCRRRVDAAAGRRGRHTSQRIDRESREGRTLVHPPGRRPDVVVGHGRGRLQRWIDQGHSIQGVIGKGGGEAATVCLSGDCAVLIDDPVDGVAGDRLCDLRDCAVAVLVVRREAPGIRAGGEVAIGIAERGHDPVAVQGGQIAVRIIGIVGCEGLSAHGHRLRERMTLHNIPDSVGEIGQRRCPGRVGGSVFCDRAGIAVCIVVAVGRCITFPITRDLFFAQQRHENMIVKEEAD